jgi:DNA-binding CsgD family transcriptional regulator
LSEHAASGPLRLALDVADPALADRLAALLAGVPGLRLVGAGEAADAAVVLPQGRLPRAGVAPQADVEVPLTPRELEVLALLAEGASNKMIARRLGISVHTAKFHVGSLIDKLDAVGRTDAVAHAARLGVIHL